MRSKRSFQETLGVQRLLIQGGLSRKDPLVLVGIYFINNSRVDYYCNGLCLTYRGKLCFFSPGEELSIQHADAEETEDKLMELWERRTGLATGTATFQKTQRKGDRGYFHIFLGLGRSSFLDANGTGTYNFSRDFFSIIAIVRVGNVMTPGRLVQGQGV